MIPQTQYCKPLLSANGSEMIVTGHVKAELYLRGLKVEDHMEVAKLLAPPFNLGRDFFDGESGLCKLCLETANVHLI